MFKIKTFTFDAAHFLVVVIIFHRSPAPTTATSLLQALCRGVTLELCLVTLYSHFNNFCRDLISRQLLKGRRDDEDEGEKKLEGNETEGGGGGGGLGGSFMRHVWQ